MRAKKIALSNELANGERNAERLRDNLARHTLVIAERPPVRCRGSDGVLLHSGNDELIEVKEQLPPEVRFIVWGENNRCYFGFHDLCLSAAQHVLGGSR